MFSAIFAGVASLAGAILTRRDAKKERARVAAANRAEAARVAAANKRAAEAARKQNTQVRQNYYKNVVSDAQAAGINPLTALRTGGGQGYATAVAGTMVNPVFMEGAYLSPVLSRNPLAAGLEAATNTYLSELTRQKQYTHEGRMDELNKSLMRAQIQSMTAQLSRDPALPPLEDRHNYVLDERGQFVLDGEGRAIKRDPYTRKQMQSDYVTYGASGEPATVTSLNLENLEGSPQEVKGSLGIIYGGGAIGKIMTRNDNLTGGMPAMDPSGFGNPFGDTRVSRGLDMRWRKSVLDAIR